MGIYVGEGPVHNFQLVLHDAKPTNQKAELIAGMLALYQAVKIKKSVMTDLLQVVIKTDSEYLAKSMTEWVFKWKKNGYRNARSLPVTNKKEFQDLDVLVRYLNKLDVEVLFWHVERERNREADKLANMALDG